MSVPINERISRYLAQELPAVTHQRGHDQTFHVAQILVNGFGLSVEQAWPFALEYNARCMPPWNEHDLRRKLGEALRKPDNKPRGYLLGSYTQPDGLKGQSLPPPPIKPVYRPEKLNRVAGKLTMTIDAAFLEARSKFTCWNRSPAGVLHKLYQTDEKVLIFNDWCSQGQEIWEHPGPAGNMETLDRFKVNCDNGVWFLAQPVTGEFIQLDRLKTEHNPSGRSRRCEECVTAWRYAVLESDEAPVDLWLKALVQIPLRISAIYTSGGKSVHALVRIDAESKAHWDHIVRDELLPILVTLGADPDALTAVRLTRLPGCMREEKHQLQTLLYLNDNPDNVPIWQKPIRESPQDAWLRWADSLIYWSYDETVNPDKRADALRIIAGLKAFADNKRVTERLAELEAIHVT